MDQGIISKQKKKLYIKLINLKNYFYFLSLFLYHEKIYY